VWVHEISHVLRDHGDRCSERCARAGLWNLAADLEINDAVWQGLEPPRRYPPMLPGDFQLPAGKLAEYYYRQLSDTADLEGGERHDEGSGVHGQRRPWEVEADHADAPAVSPLEQETIRREVAESIQKEKRRGTMPGGWGRWADATLKPRIDWREQLRRRVRGAVVMGVGGRLDYSFQRPHRRAQIYAPLIRPRLCGDCLPRVACVVDTSGSISNVELAHLMAEVRGVLDSLRLPIIVIPCDAVAYEPIEVLTNSDFLQLCRQLRGRGGTNMVVGIEAALKLRPSPDIVIVLTDGCTPYPARPYRIPVVFGILKTAWTPYDTNLLPIPPWRSDDIIHVDAHADS
jgi:predicted metal-dependent peptidase